MSMRKYSSEDKLRILQVVESNKYTLDEIASMYSVNISTIKDWRYKFHKYGAASLTKVTTQKKYSGSLKYAAIEDFLSGQYSLREITRKYEISDKNVLRNWIQKYNGHREIRTSSKGMKHSMTKGRSTTHEERIAIVLYCLSNQKDYQRAVEAYDVSYQQIYSWVRKYENDGEEGLADKRGKRKPNQELTPEEIAKREMQKLQQENERLRAENEFLKKLDQLERRWT